jgi:predicted hotdog family 3-hydroxylacyl-ACP dehydratase
VSLAREDIAALIPHRGAMCLLERVLEWDARRIVLATHTHAAPDNPLRLGGRLRAIHACEYGAQAAAVHGSLSARAGSGAGAAGMIVTLREVRLFPGDLHLLPGELLVEAEHLLGGAAGWQYAFSLRHAGSVLASGRVTVMAARAARNP